MFVLSRKSHESVVIGDEEGIHRLFKVTVLGIQDQHVELGFEVPNDVPVQRSEHWERIRDAAGQTC